MRTLQLEVRNMVDWLTPTIGFVGVALGAGISEYRRWRDNKDQFRVLTFEKRLKIHQQAFAHLCKMGLKLSAYKNLKDSPTNEYQKTLKSSTDSAYEWYLDNCLSLDEVTQNKFIEFIIEAEHYSIFKDSSKKSDMLFDEVRKAITQGIGVQHLPEIHDGNIQKHQDSANTKN
jgi:hypothetical protein